MTRLTNNGVDKAHTRFRAGIQSRPAEETAMTDQASIKDKALTSDDLDRVAGGIIIVGGLQRHFTSVLERVALNPQPLPPRVFAFGH